MKALWNLFTNIKTEEMKSKEKEPIVITPSCNKDKIKQASARINGVWMYKLPNLPEMQIKRVRRFWMYKIPTINGIETQAEDVFYNALLDLHLSKATIYLK